MKYPRLGWNGDEGTAKFPREFLELDWIDRADALKDWIGLLTEEYDRTVGEFTRQGTAPNYGSTQ